MRKLLLLMLIVAFAASISFAVTGENELKKLIKQMEETEDKLYVAEFSLDALYGDLMRYDGFWGWFEKTIFKRKSYKRLKANVETKEQEVRRIYSKYRSLARKIQNKIFEIGYQYEQNGQYKKAIEWYFKLEKLNYKAKFRVGYCYKKLKNFAEALKWFFQIEPTGKDEVYFEIGDCYELWKKPKEAISWYFKALENFSNNQDELKIIKRLEKINYPNKKKDYPDFDKVMSDIFVKKALANYDKNQSLARQDFRKAAKYLQSYNNLPTEKAAANAIVDRYDAEVAKAKQLLAEQRVKAEQYYQSKLREAQHRYERARREYEVELQEAERSYTRELQWAYQRYQDARAKYDRLKQQGATQEELNSAWRNVEYWRRRYESLNTTWAHEKYVEDYVEDEKAEMERAYKRYKEVIDKREEIINEFLRPYMDKVKKAEAIFRRVSNLYRMVY